MKQTNILLKAVLFIAVVILFGSLAQKTRAANFVVNSTLDRQDRINGDGSCETITARQCTLRAAITEANASPGDDIITLPAGTYQIFLTAAGENNNAGGDFDITSNITINGAGAGNTFIQADSFAGTATERVLHFISGTSTVNSVTVRYGGTTSTGAGSRGAGIGIDESASLTLNSVSVSNNISLRSGGGISNFGTLTVNNSLITNNFAGAVHTGGFGEGGAGLYIVGDTTLNNTTVSFNRASSNVTGLANPGIYGGGVWAFGGDLNINNSSINNNTAIIEGDFYPAAYGGGLAVYGAVVTVTDSSVSNNDAIADSGAYGGIAVPLGRLTLNRTIVSGNNNGGIGITSIESSYSSQTYINQSAIVNNIGTGILIGNGSRYTEINNSTIAKNKTNFDGGGIYNFSASSVLNVNFSTIARNVAGQDNSNNRSGGGIFGRANLKNSIVADNTVGTGGKDPDISGVITSQGYNHVENVGTATFDTAISDVTGIDPMLGELIMNGSNSVFIPATNSPVIDAIPNGTNDCGTAPFNVDQRGVSRPTDSNGDAVAACEKGAVERVSPTAASITVSGRVLAGKQRGVSGAIVYLTNSEGNSRTTRTNAFGYYRFEELSAGETYVVNVFAKSFTFEPQVLTVAEEIHNLDFLAET